MPFGTKGVFFIYIYRLIFERDPNWPNSDLDVIKQNPRWPPNANCISPNVGRYYSLVTGPPPPPAMEATMEAMEATERFRRLLDAEIHFGIYLAQFG